jgi:hypothetical protein
MAAFEVIIRGGGTPSAIWYSGLDRWHPGVQANRGDVGRRLERSDRNQSYRMANCLRVVAPAMLKRGSGPIILTSSWPAATKKKTFRDAAMTAMQVLTLTKIAASRPGGRPLNIRRQQ